MKRFLISICIMFAVPIVCCALPMAACVPSELVEWIDIQLILSLCATAGFVLAYPILRIGRDGVVQRRKYMAPLVIALGTSFLVFSGTIPVATNFLFGAIHLRPGLPEFLAGWGGIYFLTGIASFLLTLVVKLWDAVAT